MASTSRRDHGAPPRRPRRLVRRLVKLAATCLLIAVVGAWALSRHYVVSRLWWTPGGGESGVWLTGGRIGYTRSSFRQGETAAETRFLRQNIAHWNWWFSYRGRSPPLNMGILYIPLWAPGVLLLAGTGRMWWRDWQGRFGPGRCPRCGYDLAGLAAAVCPECGRGVREESHDPASAGNRNAPP